MAVPFDVRLHHPQPPQAPARAAKCELHPEQSFTGFCSSCLLERLAILEPATRLHLNSCSSPCSTLPELRRCRSYSGAGGAPPAPTVEPKRRSCDVRIRSTLLSLFYLGEEPTGTSARRSSDIEPRNLGFAAPLPEEDHEGEPEEEESRDAKINTRVSESGGEIRAELAGENLRPIKDLIDLESKSKGPAKGSSKDFGGSFWLAASVFSKKLQKWRRRKPGGAIRGGRSSSQPELYENVPGRLSLDAGRISIDGPRYSLDEARASWDGNTLRNSSRQVPFRQLSTVSIGEQIPRRSDVQIPVEDHSFVPGGTAQTRAYYSETLPQRRRRNLDRSGSARRSSVDGADDLPLKPTSISRISPTIHEYFHLVQSAEREEFTDNRWKPEKSRSWSKNWNIWSLIQQRREPERPFPEELPDKKQTQALESLHRSSTSSDMASRCSTDCRRDKGRKKSSEKDWSDGTHSLANDLLRLY